MLTRRSVILSAAGLSLGFSSAALARPSAGAVVAPIRLEQERVIIDAMINGQGPMPFAIDTGAVVSGLEVDVARRLGLPVIRKVRLAGRPFDLYKVDELVLGGAVRQPDAALFGLTLNLRGANGLLAAGLVTTFDSQLDFDRLEWRVFPAGLGDTPGFEPLPSWIRQDAGSAQGSRRIGVKVMLDGQPLSLVVDTGLPKTLVLENGVGRKLGYWNDDRDYAPASSVGIAGPAPRPGRVMRARDLTIGGLRFDAPLVTVRDAPRMQQDYDGILGLPIIERMNLSVDSRKAILLARPSGRPARDESVNRTGLWIDEAPGGAKVSVVGRGSPAQAAGLKVGDRINGPSFGAILKSLSADGPVSLDVQGRGLVSLTPRKYI